MSVPLPAKIRRRRRRPGFQDRTILSDDLTVIYKPHTTPSVDVTESTIESTRDFTMIPPIQTIDATTSSPSSNSSDEKVPLSIEAFLQLKSTHNNAKTYGKRKRRAVVDLNHGLNGFNSDDAAMGSGSGEDESQEMSGVTSDTVGLYICLERAALSLTAALFTIDISFPFFLSKNVDVRTVEQSRLLNACSRQQYSPVLNSRHRTTRIHPLDGP